MAKKVKFPLKLADGSKVSTIEDLREHFDLASILSYYSNERLTEWLRDRYYDEEADKIEALDSSAPGFKQSLCEAFGVEYIANGTDNIDLADITAKNERRERLKMFTADEKILAAVDCVAFTQEDLTALLASGAKEIYLCGERFEISGDVENVAYIGVDDPKVNAPDGFLGKGIVFKNINLGIEDTNRILTGLRKKLLGVLLHAIKHVNLATEEIVQQAIEAPQSEDATLWLQAARLGDAKAQYMAGLRYYRGDSNVRQSYEKAAIWCRKAAEQGYADAQNHLANCYFDGKGVEQDYEEAVIWYRKAVEQGHAWAQDNLGNCYYNGKGVEKNHETAVEWYRKAAEQGYDWAQNNFGNCYYNGKGVAQDYVEAVKWYSKAAEQGNANAQNHLANCYFDGEGVAQDYTEAVRWYRKAAEQGHALAQNNLGLCYFRGKGVAQDYVEAVKWCGKAAEQDYAVAQNNLGDCYYSGQGVAQDYAEAVKWYSKAAGQGTAVAQNNLGNCYYNGKGVEKNHETAVEWYRKAAEQGNANAQLALGRMYYRGRGVAKDEEEAVKWYMKLAEQGIAEAKAALDGCTDTARVAEVYFEKVSRLLSESHVFVTKNIPEKKLRNAKDAYVRGMEPNETLLLLYDHTVWGSAKDGCLLTNKALYFNFSRSSNRVPVKDIIDIRLERPGRLVVQTLNQEYQIDIILVCASDISNYTAGEIFSRLLRVILGL